MPSECPISTTCTGRSPVAPGLPCQAIDPGSNTVIWNFTEDDYTDGSVPPGTYTFTYEVSTVPGGPVQTFDVILTVPDPCENATV